MVDKLFNELKLPSKVYVITCRNLGDSFSTEKEARDAIKKLSELTGLKEKDFGYIILNFAGLRRVPVSIP
jgi:hypothetical protein